MPRSLRESSINPRLNEQGRDTGSSNKMNGFEDPHLAKHCRTTEFEERRNGVQEVPLKEFFWYVLSALSIDA